MVDSKTISFSLLQWNTLAKNFADKEAFPYVDEKYLKWEYRSTLLLKIMKENESDIICLEEVQNFDEFKQEIIDKLDIKYDLLYENTKSGLGNILGVNKNKFIIEKNEKIFLKEDKEGKKGGKVLISVILKDIKSGNKFVVMVTHLKSKKENEEFRIYQMNHIMEYIENNFIDKYPIFLLGDFNAEPTYTCINNLLSNQKIKMKSIFDFSKLEFTTIKIRDKLYQRIIDYIFYVGKNKEKTEQEIKVLSNEKGKPLIDQKIGLPNDVFPSDHVYLKAKVCISYD